MCLYFFIITQHLLISNCSSLCPQLVFVRLGTVCLALRRRASALYHRAGELRCLIKDKDYGMSFNSLSCFLILQSRGEIKNGTILRLAISPVSALCLLFYSLCVTVAAGSICGLPLENIPGFYMPVTNFVSCNFLQDTLIFTRQESSALKRLKAVDFPRLIPASSALNDNV